MEEQKLNEYMEKIFELWQVKEVLKEKGEPVCEQCEHYQPTFTSGVGWCPKKGTYVNYNKVVCWIAEKGEEQT